MTPKDNPLVTIGMVTYNSGDYVSQAIESVLNSDYPNIELIISDDNSSDETWNIINSYDDSRIIALKNNANIGEYCNREKCINKASGKYFIFIDGDDMIYPWGIDFAVSQMEKFHNAGMALAMQWRDYVFYPYILTPKENMLFTYFGDSFLNNSFAQTLFKTDVLKNAMPFPKWIRSGDNYVKKKISLTNDVLLINGPIAWWRQTPGQASQKLKEGIVGHIESWKIDTIVLSDKHNPLSENEICEIWRNKHYALFLIIIKQLFAFNLTNVLALLQLTSFKSLLRAKKCTTCRYRANGSSIDPLKL